MCRQLTHVGTRCDPSFDCAACNAKRPRKIPGGSEAEIQRAIMLAFGADPRLRLWRANTGTAKDPITGRVVRFGTPGQADLSGLILPLGRRLEIEVKSATGKQSEDQISFQRMIESFGGLYVLARSVADVTRALSA